MNLLEKRDRVLTLPALENRMTLLEEEIREAEDDLSKLREQYKRENRNVERLEKESFSALLLRLVGKLETRLEETKLDEINAKLAYDRASTHIGNLMDEKLELTSRISALKAEEKTYSAELEARRIQIAKQLNEPQGIRYAELGLERNNIISQISKLGEALRVASLSASTARKIATSLDKAEGWATADIFIGGILVHLAKYSHIDDAENNFHILSSQLRELMYELRDVPDLTIPSLNIISSTQRTIDFWFSNIFTSLSVRDKIEDNAEEISKLLNNIMAIEAALKAKLKEQQSKYAANRRDEEELLLHTS